MIQHNITFAYRSVFISIVSDLLITVQFSTASGLTVKSVFREDPPRKTKSGDSF